MYCKKTHQIFLEGVFLSSSWQRCVGGWMMMTMMTLFFLLPQIFSPFLKFTIFFLPNFTCHFKNLVFLILPQNQFKKISVPSNSLHHPCPRPHPPTANRQRQPHQPHCLLSFSCFLFPLCLKKSPRLPLLKPFKSPKPFKKYFAISFPFSFFYYPIHSTQLTHYLSPILFFSFSKETH